MSQVNHFCRICFDRFLPNEPMGPPIVLSAAGSGPAGAAANMRARSVIFFRKLWPNGSVLRVRFMGGSQAQQRLAMEQAQWWSNHAHLRFVPSDATDAEIRVTFDPADGAWSYIGTDCRGIPTNAATMNLGFQDGGTSAHEFGHAIGLGHEHQNPTGGLQWNEPEVIRDLSGPPNSWTVDQIRHNVLVRYSTDQVRSTQFDPDSIMLYSFPSRWTTNGIGTHANDVISPADAAFVALNYPKPGTPTGPVPGVAPVALTVGAAGVSAKIGAPGEEDLFSFQVAQTGRHVMETKGKTDLVMKLYGPDNPTLLIAEDDDAGVGLNPRIIRVLNPGTYLMQVRHYSGTTGTGAYTIQVKR